MRFMVTLLDWDAFMVQRESSAKEASAFAAQSQAGVPRTLPPMTLRKKISCMIFELRCRTAFDFLRLLRACVRMRAAYLKRGGRKVICPLEGRKGLGQEKMYLSDVEWKVSPHRYSAKQMAKPVNFACFAPKARLVTLAGDFNQWEKHSHPMNRQPDGAWTLQLQMNHGHHQYAFFVDGQATLDPRANGTTRHPQLGNVSLVSIS
jgi:hypothetical protein